MAVGCLVQKRSAARRLQACDVHFTRLRLRNAGHSPTAASHRRAIKSHANDPELELVQATWSSDGLPARSHDAVSAFTGRVNCNVAPWGRFAVAQSRPPWASMIERQIESPIPMPLDLVVKKALNSRSAFSAEIPSP